MQMSSCTAVLASAYLLLAGAGNGQTQSNQQQASSQNFYITTPQTGAGTSVGPSVQTTANTYLTQTSWQRPTAQAAATSSRGAIAQQQAYTVQQVSNQASRQSVQQASANFYANQSNQQSSAAANYYQTNVSPAQTTSNHRATMQTVYPAAYVSNATPQKQGFLSRLTGRKPSQPARQQHTHQNQSPAQTFKGMALKASKYAGSMQQGVASWYGGKWHGRKTASGERYNQETMTAAHKTLPFGTVVKVTNERNGRECLVRINNRGPFTKGRIIDLSKAAARQLGMINSGVAKVKMEVVGRS